MESLPFLIPSKNPKQMNEILNIKSIFISVNTVFSYFTFLALRTVMYNINGEIEW